MNRGYRYSKSVALANYYADVTNVAAFAQSRAQAMANFAGPESFGTMSPAASREAMAGQNPYYGYGATPRPNDSVSSLGARQVNIPDMDARAASYQRYNQPLNRAGRAANRFGHQVAGQWNRLPGWGKIAAGVGAAGAAAGAGIAGYNALQDQY